MNLTGETQTISAPQTTQYSNCCFKSTSQGILLPNKSTLMCLLHQLEQEGEAEVPKKSKFDFNYPQKHILVLFLQKRC